jgi:hypothetical protein
MNPIVHYTVEQLRPLFPILSEMNPVYTIPSLLHPFKYYHATYIRAFLAVFSYGSFLTLLYYVRCSSREIRANLTTSPSSTQGKNYMD